jgi:hypothetical protein
MLLASDKIGQVAEQVVVGADVDGETDCGGRDPAVCFVDLVAESASGSLARGSCFGAASHELVVGLDDRHSSASGPASDPLRTLRDGRGAIRAR